MSEQSDLSAILQEFLVEAREHLVQFELALLELEGDPTQQNALQAIFRSVHTIKGSCSYLSLHKTEAVTHAAESLLDRVRDGRQPLTTAITNTLLVMVDVVRSLLTHVESGGTEGHPDVSPLVRRLERLAAGQGGINRRRMVGRSIPCSRSGSSSANSISSSTGHLRKPSTLH